MSDTRAEISPKDITEAGAKGCTGGERRHGSNDAGGLDMRPSSFAGNVNEC